VEDKDGRGAWKEIDGWIDRIDYGQFALLLISQ